MDAVSVVGLLADDERLSVVAALVLGASTGAEIAERAGLPPKRALHALTRLEAGGLVVRAGNAWSFRIEVLREVMRLASPPDPAAADAESAILQAFIKDGRLAAIPMQRNKRLVILDRLAADFEPGRRYPEAAVNAVLIRWNDDVAALRRYLVDEAFLARDHGIYWRIGGTVEV